MPIRKQDYPPDWPAISTQVKTEAGWRCEWCGAPHKAIIRRLPVMIREEQKTETIKFQNGSSIDLLEAAWKIDYLIVPVHVQVGGPFKVDGQWVEEQHIPTATLPYSSLRHLGLTKIIITTAHLDRNTKNNARDNLAALCQRCHLRHDIRQHIANRRYGRYHNREHQLKLL